MWRLFPGSQWIPPTCLAPLNGADSHVGLGFVRQITLRNLKFRESTFVIAITIIVGESECEMAFWKIGLQSQGLISMATRFFPPARCRVELVIHPALHPRETGKTQCEVRIELDRLLEKGHRLRGSVAKQVNRLA